MGTDVNAGLTALQQADTDLAAAVTANTAASQAVVDEIAALQKQLASSEDPAVQAIAADLETKVAALTQNNTALAAAVAPPAPAPTPEPAPAPSQAVKPGEVHSY